MARSSLMRELFWGEEVAGAFVRAVGVLQIALFWAGGLLESGYFMRSAAKGECELRRKY